jgi:hypothetical protein
MKRNQFVNNLRPVVFIIFLITVITNADTTYVIVDTGQITTMQSWQGYLNNFKERIDNPVTVRFDN